MKLPTTLPEIPELIASKRDEIAALCREYGVAKLEVFGSAMTDEFDPDRSDIDFIVSFVPAKGLTRWLDSLFGLEKALADLFCRDVDVIDARARGFENRYFAMAAERTRRAIFDGHQSEIESPAA